MKTLYLLHGGSDDSSLYLRRTRIEEMPGGHEWSVWDEMVQRFLAWACQR